MTETLRTVGVVGAGVMGTGLAQSLAQSGHEVILVDRTDEILDRARQEIAQGLRFSRVLGAKGPTEDRQVVAKRIAYTTRYEGFDTVDFVIENITEDWDLKRGVYERIDPLCPRTPSSPPTPRSSRSPGSARPSPAPTGSSACIS